jgi:hypothetical protein
MDTNRSRRNLIRSISGGLLFLWVAGGRAIAAVAAPVGQDPPPKNPPPLPSPFGKDGQLIVNPPGIAGSVGTPPKVPPAPRKDLKADEKDLKKQVELLAQYADELKKEVEKTDSTKVLSVQMLRKTQDIEKLARHIVTLATS